MQANSSLIHSLPLSAPLCYYAASTWKQGKIAASRSQFMYGHSSPTRSFKDAKTASPSFQGSRRCILTLLTQRYRLTFAIVKCEYELKRIVVDSTVFQFRILASINVRDLDPKLLTQLNMRYRVRNWNHFCDLIYLPNLDIFDSCLFLPSVILALLRLDS